MTLHIYPGAKKMLEEQMQYRWDPDNGTLALKMEKAQRDLDEKFKPIMEGWKMQAAILYGDHGYIGCIDFKERKMFDINTPVTLIRRKRHPKIKATS